VNSRGGPGHRPAWPALAVACALAATGLFAAACAETEPDDFPIDPEHARVQWEVH
jgi:hypothetical protein